MFRSHLKIAFRNLARNKSLTVVNILGLALGMAVCLTILLWVRLEVSYDKFHENLEDTFIVATHLQFGPEVSTGYQSPPAMRDALLAEYPEVVEAARTRNGSTHVLKYGDLAFRESIRQVDDSFFRIMSFAFVEGDPASAYDGPYSVVLSESTARKYFGDDSALGKVISFDYNHDLTVTGVLEDMPSNSSFKFDVMMPFEFWVKGLQHTNLTMTWYNCSFTTYAQLRPGTDWQAFSDRIADRAKTADPDNNTTFFLYPLKDLHLYSISGFGGRIVLIVFTSWLALVILLIACFNFMNLATARATTRAREVGVRKVVGAGRRELVAQFYLESMMQAFAGLALALVLVEQFLPFFRELIGIDVHMNYTADPWLFLGAIAITLFTGLVAGSYPALFLSSFKPAVVLRGVLAVGARGVALRRALVVLQFIASIVLFVLTTSLYEQVEQLGRMDLGYDRTNVVFFRMDNDLKPEYQALKTELLRNNHIQAVTRASHSLAGVYTNGSGWDWEEKHPGADPLVTYLRIGLDYEKVLKPRLAAGRFFTEADLNNGGRNVMVNETFAGMISEESAVGKMLWRKGSAGAEEGFQIIGVFEDFHYKPIGRRIGPLMAEVGHAQSDNFVFLRLDGAETAATMEEIESVYQRFMPGRLFEYTFMEDQIGRMYSDVSSFADLLRLFTFLAVLISCLGLYGLASFITERRFREIGLRKVLGASVTRITSQLTREFVLCVLVANLIALPISLLMTLGVTGNVSNRIGFSLRTFLTAAAVSVLLAALTVGFRTMRAAMSNPADAIRYE